MGRRGRRLLTLALALALGNCAPAGARQLTDLRSDARVLAKDSGTARQRFTDSDIDNWLNEAARLMIARTECIERSFQFELTAGATYYPLPSDFLTAHRVTWEQQYLQEMSPAALDGRSRGWPTATGTPTYYFIHFASRNVVGFAPWPADTSSTGTIRMDYYASPSTMTANGDAPFDGIGVLVSYHHALPYFAAARMALVDGRGDVFTAYTAIFEQYVAVMKDRCMERPNYLPSASGGTR